MQAAATTNDEIQARVGAMLDGTMPEADMRDTLLALGDNALSAPLICAAVEAVMVRATRFDAPEHAIDVCGTGGDGTQSVNISTTVAFVVAASGVPVVKHGNRAVSSRAGSADVLSALGFSAQLSPAFWQAAMHACGIAFLFAPHFHPGLVRLAPIRKALGVRTVFNVLGPLCNPAQPKRQLMGVYSPTLLPIIAEVLKARGSAHAWVVHGNAGEDELSVSGSTQVAEVTPGAILRREVMPADAAVASHKADALRGGIAEENAKAMVSLFEGATGAYRDAVVLNAAAALVVAGVASSLREAREIAAETLASGKALQLLKNLHALAEKADAHA